MVGASILNIITESLYDNPIVVFREYVQNSVDAIYKTGDAQTKKIDIWSENENLFFIDNGIGIERSEFQKKMTSIGASSKSKRFDLGYKGIGRLSGVPYCQDLFFINICNYAKGDYQTYKISGDAYYRIKSSDEYEQLDFEGLMQRIGTYSDDIPSEENNFIANALNNHADMFKTNATGFLVILYGVKKVLFDIMKDNCFHDRLSWLLPVDFQSNLYTSKIQDLINEIKKRNEPFRACNISYNGKEIKRPIRLDMLRDYSCLTDFTCAQGFFSFSGSKILIDKNNPFSGIRIYIDNMLLCDETELIQNLANYHLLSHTVNGTVQAVKGVGVIIYISDKISVSANARRTFIEVSDQTSFEFLRKISEFVDRIYDARYALSNYASAKKNNEEQNRISELRTKALGSLQKLAEDKIELTQDDIVEFDNLSDDEKKRILKLEISSKNEKYVNEYIGNLKSLEKENAYEKFLDWLVKKDRQ